MIFFSFMSVNSGVAGRSRAKNRNGEDTVCISVRLVSRTPPLSRPTSANVEHWPALVLVDDDLLRLNLNLALKGGVDHTRAPFLRSPKISVQSIDQPAEEFHWITLFRHLEFAITPLRDFLQKLVWTNLGFEQARVP